MDPASPPWIVRDAASNDHARIAELFVELGVPDAPPSRDEFVEKLLAGTFVVCAPDGAIVGYGLARVSGERWYVSNVVTAPEARGRGVGRAIMDEHARRARAAGLPRWALNVKRDNHSAIRLYERCGMTITGRSVAVRIPWAAVGRLPDSPVCHVAPIATPDDEAAVERTLRLPAGVVAAERARAGKVVVALRAEGAWVGFASFDPHFPGASPFRVADARWLRAMLEAVRPHARPEDTLVRTTVEDDPGSEACLRDAGAETIHELFTMSGPLA